MWEKTPLGQSSCEVQPEQEETLQGSKLQDEDNRPGGGATGMSVCICFSGRTLPIRAEKVGESPVLMMEG